MLQRFLGNLFGIHLPGTELLDSPVSFQFCFLNSCGCLTAKSKTPPQETLFSSHLTSTEHGSPPYLTTRDRELVSVLEVIIEPETSDSTIHHSTMGWVQDGVQHWIILGGVHLVIHGALQQLQRSTSVIDCNNHGATRQWQKSSSLLNLNCLLYN